MPTDAPVAQITDEIVRRFEALSATRDRALGEGRRLVRLAATSVRATHRGELAEAARLLAAARARLDALTAELRPFPNLSRTSTGPATSRTRRRRSPRRRSPSPSSPTAPSPAPRRCGSRTPPT